MSSNGGVTKAPHKVKEAKEEKPNKIIAAGKKEEEKKMLPPFTDDSVVDMAINMGNITYERGDLKAQYGLDLGDKMVHSWFVTSHARDPKNPEEWIALFQHVTCDLDHTLDLAQTYMLWATENYDSPIDDEIDAEWTEVSDWVKKTLKTEIDPLKPFGYQTKHLAIRASPTYSKVVLALDYCRPVFDEKEVLPIVKANSDQE